MVSYNPVVDDHSELLCVYSFFTSDEVAVFYKPVYNYEDAIILDSCCFIYRLRKLNNEIYCNLEL